MIRSGHITLWLLLLSLFMVSLSEGAVNDTSPNWVATPGDGDGEGGKEDDGEEFASGEIDDDQSGSGSNYYEPPSISIKGEVIPGEEAVATESAATHDEGSPQTSWYEHIFTEESLLTLVDTWWKILLWCLLLLVLLSVCCYFTRCCYLVWDCCTDPFWGCCPRCGCCETFLRVEKHAYAAAKARMASEYYDGKAADVTVYEEGMPQLYDTQYFNWLHLFGLKTGGRCGEYSIAVNERSGRDDERAGLAATLGEDEIDFTEAQANSSFNSTNSHAEVKAKWSSNSDKNGLHIEHGHIGRYQPLPNKEFELVPIVRNRDVHRLSNSFKRKSRSMESFGKEALRAAAQAEQRAANGGVISKSQADIHAVPTAVSKSVSNKYSQTDLTVDTEPAGGGMVTSTVASSGYGTSRSLGGTPSPRAASLGGSARGPTQCPLPKPPAPVQQGSHQVKGHRRQKSVSSSAGPSHHTNSLPKTVFNTLSSDPSQLGMERAPSFVNGHQPVYGRNSFGYSGPPEAMEKEILFGKETKILI